MTAHTRQRIMIIGQPGSGKSTLARALGEKLNLPVVHIDLIHWQPGWLERQADEKTRLCEEVHQRPQWIFEGGHSRTWSQRLQRADTLIWLDFPLYVRAFRVIKRTLQHHGHSRPDLPDNCPEHFNWEFTSWIWNTRNSARQKMQQLFDSVPAHKSAIRLQSRAQVANFLATVSHTDHYSHNTQCDHQ